MTTLYDPAHVLPTYLVRIERLGSSVATHYVVPPAGDWMTTWQWARSEYGAPIDDGVLRWAVIPYTPHVHNFTPLVTVPSSDPNFMRPRGVEV